MKKIVFIFLFIASNSFAGTAMCNTISDHDSRMMCMASATGVSAYCTSIHDKDLRARCYASLGK